MFVASSTAVFGGLEQALDEMLPLGIGALEAYELNVPGHPELRHVGVAAKTDSELTSLRAQFHERDARLCALSGHTDLLDPDPEGRAASVAHLRRCLAAAGVLGCPIVVTASGHLRGDPGEAMRSLVDALRGLGDVAAEHGVHLAVEAHYEEFMQSTADVVRLMQQVDHPRVGINYDPFHFVFLGEDIAASARTAAQWVIHTHIHDVTPSGADDVPWHAREEIPGRGVIDWPAVLEALHRAGYDGALSIELHKVFADLATDHETSRDYLCGLLQDLDG